MSYKKIIIRRLLMTLLFLTALLTTYTSITGVEAKELTEWFIGEEKYIQDHHKKEMALKPKVLPSVPTKGKELSSQVVKTSKTLEEAIDWSKYPIKTVVATGYTAGVESTGKTADHPAYGLTYSGVKVKRDLYSTIAADTSVFPIGTILFIPEYGYGVVADTGSAIKGNKIDLYFETVKDVYDQWGKKEVAIYIVEKGDGNLTDEHLTKLNENEAMQVFRSQYIAS